MSEAGMTHSDAALPAPAYLVAYPASADLRSPLQFAWRIPVCPLCGCQHEHEVRSWEPDPFTALGACRPRCAFGLAYKPGEPHDYLVQDADPARSQKVIETARTGGSQFPVMPVGHTPNRVWHRRWEKAYLEHRTEDA